MALGLPGYFGQAAAQETGRRADAKVYLLRGLLNIWSTGLDSLAMDLRRRNIEAKVFNHLEVSTVVMQAVADYRAHRVRHLVFIGHSWGADAALRAAKALNEARVPVDLIVTFDASYGSTAPANVRKVVNFYLSSGLGSPVGASKNFHGVLQNIDESKNSEIMHFNIEKIPALQDRVVKLVLSTVNSR